MSEDDFNRVPQPELLTASIHVPLFPSTRAEIDRLDKIEDRKPAAVARRLILAALQQQHPDKEHEARKLINGLRGDDVFDLWPAEEVFDYLEADGYEWNSVEWIITGRSPWNGFDDTGLVPALT